METHAFSSALNLSTLPKPQLRRQEQQPMAILSGKPPQFHKQQEGKIELN